MDTRLKKLFAGTYYTFFVNGATALLLGTIIPFICSDYNIGYETTGLFLAAHAVGNLLASFIISFSNSYIGRKKSVIIFSSLIAIGYIGIISTSVVPVLFLMFFLTGVGRGSVSNTDNAIINDSAVGESKYLNLLHTCYAIGAFLTPLVMSLLIRNGVSWKTGVSVEIMLAISMVITYILLDIPEVAKKKVVVKSEEGAEPFYKNVNFYLAGFVLFFYLGAESTMNGFVVTYLKDTGMLSVENAQMILSVLWIVIIFGRLFCAKMSTKIKKTDMILINSFGAMVVFIFFRMSTTLPTIAISMMLFGFFFAGIYPTTIAASGKIIKGSTLALGCLLAIAGLGGILMPLITGFVASKAGISAGMTCIMISTLLTTIFAFLLKIRSKE